MKRLSKEDLAQMNKDYFKSLDKERLVEVAGNLHSLAVEQLERLEQNSKNSSKPPSSDSPFQVEAELLSTQESGTQSKTSVDKTEDTNSIVQDQNRRSLSKGFGKKQPGKQVGAKGMWRAEPLVSSITRSHHPETCAACNSALVRNDNAKPHMGYHVLELEKQNSGIEVNCQLHHYYGATCKCGHYTKALPG